MFLAVILAFSLQTVEIRGTGRVVHLETSPGEPFDAAQVARDVRRLWGTGWFADVRAEAAGEGVIFTVVEKPRVYLGRVRFEPERWKRPAVVEPGAVIDGARAKRLAVELRRRLVEEGYKDAAVEAEVVPAGFRVANVVLRVDAGAQYRVREVRFSGNVGVEVRRLEKALRATRSRWLRRPLFNERAVEGDLERVRSLYASLGYFDAEVRLGGVEFAGEAATITIAVEAGPRDEAANFGDMCRCLMEARRESERRGVLDFAARLEERRAQVEEGPAYRVGRIEFRGHHVLGDLTLRRAFRLEEGELFDRSLLRQSLARVDRMGIFEPVTERDSRVAGGSGSAAGGCDGFVEGEAAGAVVDFRSGGAGAAGRTVASFGGFAAAGVGARGDGAFDLLRDGEPGGVCAGGVAGDPVCAEGSGGSADWGGAAVLAWAGVAVGVSVVAAVGVAGDGGGVLDRQGAQCALAGGGRRAAAGGGRKRDGEFVVRGSGVAVGVGAGGGGLGAGAFLRFW